MRVRQSRSGFTLVALTAAILIAIPAKAQTIYRGKDAKGAPVFTDQPRPGDQPLELPPVNTTPAPPTMPVMGAPRSAEFAGYSQISLGAPGSVPNAFTPVNITINIQPELQPSHLWQLRLDGAVVAEGRDADYAFDHLVAGLHTLSLSVVDGNGASLGEAATVTVLVRQANRPK